MKPSIFRYRIAEMSLDRVTMCWLCGYTDMEILDEILLTPYPPILQLAKLKLRKLSKSWSVTILSSTQGD